MNTQLERPEELDSYVSNVTRMLSGELPDDQAADLAIIEINSIQSRISAVVATAVMEIRRLQNVRIYFIQQMQGCVRDHAINSIPLKKDGTPKRKSYSTIGGGSVFLSATGGKHILVNREDYEEWVNNLSVQELREYGGKFTIPHAKKLELLKQGVHVPGHDYVEKDEWGKIRYGIGTAWSVDKLKDSIKAALGGTGRWNDDDKEEDDEE